jgi:hypothetical protein
MVKPLATDQLFCPVIELAYFFRPHSAMFRITPNNRSRSIIRDDASSLTLKNNVLQMITETTSSPTASTGNRTNTWERQECLFCVFLTLCLLVVFTLFTGHEGP